MSVTVAQILATYGQSVVGQIRQNLSSTGTNATGKTSRSVTFHVERQGTAEVLVVQAKKYFMVVETGRKPTPGVKPSRDFVANIREWMAARGKQGSAYAIARSINEKGSSLYRKGGRKDVVSNVVTPSLFQRISEDVLKNFANAYIAVLK